MSDVAINTVFVALVMSLLILILTGCATTQTPEPVVQIVYVDKLVPVPCSPDIGPEPLYADTPGALRSVPTVFGRVQLILAAREARVARLGELHAALDVCAGDN